MAADAQVKNLGLLGLIMEANEIQQELGVSPARAFAIQRERWAERLEEDEREAAERNVVQFRPRGA
jgi:hypothetical protein